MNIDKKRSNGTAVQPDPGDIAACIAWLEDRYLLNSRDAEFEEYLREILEVDRQGMITAAPVRNPLNGETTALAVLGASGAGKTVMIRRNLEAISCLREMDGKATGNYLHITVPPEATIKSLAGDLLRKTGYGTVSGSAKAYDLWAVLRHRLKTLRIVLIWIDEAHHLLRAGGGRDVSGALRTLKNLLQGQGAVAVILSGVPKLDEDLLTDPETSRRFMRLRLQSVGDHADELERIQRFLKICCEKVGLGAPEDRYFAERLLFAENGAFGKILLLAKRSIRRALMSRSPSLTLEHVRRSFEIMHGTSGQGPFADVDWPMLKESLLKKGWA